MTKSTKKSLAFFLVVLCGVGLYNCKPKPQAKVTLDDVEKAYLKRFENYKVKTGNPNATRLDYWNYMEQQRLIKKNLNHGGALIQKPSHEKVNAHEQ